MWRLDRQGIQKSGIELIEYVLLVQDVYPALVTYSQSRWETNTFSSNSRVSPRYSTEMLPSMKQRDVCR